MTKYFVAVLVAIGLTLAGQAKNKQEGSSSAPEKTAVKEQKAGRKLAQTPFGTSDYGDAEPPDEEPETLATSPHVEVEEKGDTIIFKRKTPFGNQVWKKKRAELTAEERQLLNRRRKAAAKAKPAAETKTAAKPDEAQKSAK